MRIVFMGTPEIAAVCLQRVYEDGHEIRCFSSSSGGSTIDISRRGCFAGIGEVPAGANLRGGLWENFAATSVGHP